MSRVRNTSERLGWTKHQVYTLFSKNKSLRQPLPQVQVGRPHMTSDIDRGLTVEATKPEILKDVVKQNIRAVEDEDEEKDCIIEDPCSGSSHFFQETKLENLPLPQAHYSTKPILRVLKELRSSEKCLNNRGEDE